MTKLKRVWRVIEKPHAPREEVVPWVKENFVNFRVGMVRGREFLDTMELVNDDGTPIPIALTEGALHQARLKEKENAVR